MADTLLQAESFENNWVRFERADQPQAPVGGLELALHTTRFECWYSILYSMQLLPSWSSEPGHDFVVRCRVTETGPNGK